MIKHIHSIPPNSGAPDRHKILNEADQLYAHGKYKEAKISYLRYFKSYKYKYNLPRYAMERAGIQGFTVIPVIGYKLVYFPIPKCACTSLCHMLYELMYQHPFDLKEHKKYIHQFFKLSTSTISIDPYKEYFKFTVIRDPIQRFVSGYRNRIVHHNDIKEILLDTGQSDVPDISTFALQIDDYMLKSLSVSRHFGLQRVRLSNNMALFDAIYPLEEIDRLIQELSLRVGKDLILKHRQTGGPSMSIQDLSSDAFEKLLEFYALDYELLADFYPVKRIKDLYRTNEL